MRIAVSGEHLINVAFTGRNKFQDRNVERAAAQIVDRHMPALFFVQSISERRCRRLVDQAQNFEACNFARIFCGLALRVIKICRHSDHRAVDVSPRYASAHLRSSRKINAEISGGGKRFIPELDANDIFA